MSVFIQVWKPSLNVFLLREIFVILFFVNSGAVFGLASVTFLRCCPSEVCEVRASAFDVSAHDSRLF